ncbi:MAG: electron transfer flavoprotein subunit beta/FixA family protein [Actinobacteria bacterium]|nr:MAG: electron transfer flavoprotein subunit beta/FixA family protein [Actinomycetota bacterium]
MKLVVAVKQIKVLGDEVEFTDDGRDVDPDYLDTALNEWDACATEEALRIRERLGEGEVVVVTVGDEEAESALRRCLAMGADRAIRVDAEPLDPVSTARALAGVVGSESPDLVLTGVQSADSVQGSTGSALAELVGLPRVAVVTLIDWSGAGPATVDRELEGGLVDVVEVDTPALLTIQTGINQPRYANLRAIKQAEQQEIAVVSADAGEPSYRVRRMFTPPRTGGAEMLDGGAAQIAQRIVEIVRERLG